MIPVDYIGLDPNLPAYSAARPPRTLHPIAALRHFIDVARDKDDTAAVLRMTTLVEPGMSTITKRPLFASFVKPQHSSVSPSRTVAGTEIPVMRTQFVYLVDVAAPVPLGMEPPQRTRVVVPSTPLGLPPSPWIRRPLNEPAASVQIRIVEEMT